MDSSAITLKKLAEQVLKADGSMPLELLLERLAPVERLREVAQNLGLSPKGGFRIEKAPARVLAPLLAEQREAKSLEEVLALLLPSSDEPESSDVGQLREDAAAAAEARALLALRDAEVGRLREELERSREGQGRARIREAELERQLDLVMEELAHEKRAVDDAKKDALAAPVAREDKDHLHRLHELEQCSTGAGTIPNNTL